MSQTVTPLQVKVADMKVAAISSMGALVQQEVDDPTFWSVVTAAVGPYTRKIGHSPAVGALSTLVIVPIATHLAITLTPDQTLYLSTMLFLAISYGWQKWSIWRGRVNAPVQPTPAPAVSVGATT